MNIGSSLAFYLVRVAPNTSLVNVLTKVITTATWQVSEPLLFEELFVSPDSIYYSDIYIIRFMLVVLVFVVVLCLVSNVIGVSRLSLPFRWTLVHPWLFIGSVLLLLLVLCWLFLEFVFDLWNSWTSMFNLSFHNIW
jgi:hypothetical protein